MEIFTQITAYHWIALGLILLTAEMLGASGFLIGAAAAAFGMSVLVWLFSGLSVSAQITIYAIGSILSTILYFQLFKEAQSRPARPLLNNRAKRLIGHQFELSEDLTLGSARVQIGDTIWKVHSPEPLTKGTRVKVVATDKMSLEVAPL